jgi:hypothetical protein
MKLTLFAFLVVAVLCHVSAQEPAAVIINELGNSGTKKALYTGGEYIELLVVKPGGVNMGGWYLTDIGSPTGTAKETEGAIQFLKKDGSVFNEIIPQGTYVLVCLGKRDDMYGAARLTEDVSLSDGNNRIVVFAYDSPAHVAATEGTIVLTGKDNLALVSDWKKEAAVNVVAWGGSTSWTGCGAAQLSLESGDNGKILYFAPKEKNLEGFGVNTDPAFWVSTADNAQATPGVGNPGIDDAILQKR